MYSAVNTFEWCVLHIFLSGLKKKKKKKNCLRILAYLSFSLLLLFKLDWNHLLRWSSRLWKAFIRSPQSHTPSTPNHSRMAFTSAPCRALPLVEKAMWKHSSWHCVSTDSQHCDLSFGLKTVDLATAPPESQWPNAGCSPDTSWLVFLIKARDSPRRLNHDSVSVPERFPRLWQSDGLHVPGSRPLPSRARKSSPLVIYKCISRSDECMSYLHERALECWEPLERRSTSKSWYHAGVT